MEHSPYIAFKLQIYLNGITQQQSVMYVVITFPILDIIFICIQTPLYSVFHKLQISHAANQAMCTLAQTHDPDSEHAALVRETLHARRCSSAASKNGVAGTAKVNASGDARDVA